MSYEDENPEAYAKDRHIEKMNERIAKLEAALHEVRAAIMASATDTLWMDTQCPETIVDRIDAALAN